MCFVILCILGPSLNGIKFTICTEIRRHPLLLRLRHHPPLILTNSFSAPSLAALRYCDARLLPTFGRENILIAKENILNVKILWFTDIFFRILLSWDYVESSKTLLWQHFNRQKDISFEYCGIEFSR